MVRKARRILEDIRWNGKDVAEFLGCYLTEPKTHVVFSRPARPLPLRAFSAALSRHGLRLAPATRMLFHGDRVFVDGESSAMEKRSAPAFKVLADRRELAPGARPRLRQCTSFTSGIGRDTLFWDSASRGGRGAPS